MSIVLNGGYEDDKDDGEEFMYTGMLILNFCGVSGGFGWNIIISSGWGGA